MGERSLKFRLKKSLVEQNVQENGQPRPNSMEAVLAPSRHWER